MLFCTRWMTLWKSMTPPTREMAPSCSMKHHQLQQKRHQQKRTRALLGQKGTTSQQWKGAIYAALWNSCSLRSALLDTMAGDCFRTHVCSVTILRAHVCSVTIPGHMFAASLYSGHTFAASLYSGHMFIMSLHRVLIADILSTLILFDYVFVTNNLTKCRTLNLFTQKFKYINIIIYWFVELIKNVF